MKAAATAGKCIELDSKAFLSTIDGGKAVAAFTKTRTQPRFELLKASTGLPLLGEHLHG
jgi:hypothetical protein